MSLSRRSALIDVLRVLASQLIVLHHLVRYSPMTAWLAKVSPALTTWLDLHGRLAVQPFLVMGGYLAAQSLQRRAGQPVVQQVWQRYLRLAPPLIVALGLVVLATALFADDLAHVDWLSPVPTAGTALAHVLLLQDLLEIPSISAGAWYVAIDLQLFALFVLLMRGTATRLGARLAPVVPLVLAYATAASAMVFSREPALDRWAIYYLCAYGLGALAAWARHDVQARRWLALTTVLLAFDWIADPRPRPAVALLTAMVLFHLAPLRWPSVAATVRRWVDRASDMSYSVFVCHFAVIIVASGLWERFEMQGLEAAIAMVALTWLAANALGAVVNAGVERLMTRARGWFSRGAPSTISP